MDRSTGLPTFSNVSPIENSDPSNYTTTCMFEDPAAKKAFMRLKEECYVPMIQMLEGFAVEFMSDLLFKCNLKDVKMHGGTKIPERLLKAVEHFKRVEMVKDENGHVGLVDD